MLARPYADPGQPDLRAPWAYLWWLIRAQQRTVWPGALWGVAWMVSQAAIPALLGSAIEDVVRHDRAGIVRWSAILLVLGIVQAAAGVLRHRMAVANFVVGVTRTEQLIARAVSRLGPRLGDQVASGEIANLGGNDVERIGELLDLIARFSGAIVSYIGVTVVLLLLSPGLGIVVAGGAVLVVVAVGPLVRPLERRQRFERDRRAASSSLAADTVVGLRVLRGLGGEAVFADRFRLSSQDVRRAAVSTSRVQASLDATQVVLPQALVLAVTWLGARLVLRHQLDPGQLVAVYAYAAFLVLPVQTLVEMSSKAAAARVAAARVIAVLRLSDAVPVVDPPPAPAPDIPTVLPSGDPMEIPTEVPAGSLVDPTTGLVVLPGRLTAVVTAVPEESAALVDRLGRWVDTRPDLAVTLDGRPLAGLDVAEVRRRIMVLDREATLLAGTVGELLDPPGRTGRVSVDEALAAAGAADIVSGLPEGLATELPERARTLSGGQRQRILLAQALVADPEVLVLDEPTSAVDAHTEASIGARLGTVRAGRTTVVCTTSPLLLTGADRVVLLDGGVTVVGKHRDLLATSARYRAVVTRGAEPSGGVQV